MATTRRTAIMLGAVMAAGIPAPARAISILQVTGVVAAMGEAAKALGEIADGLEKALRGGMKIWDTATARGVRDEMLLLSRDIVEFSAGQKATLALAIDEYLAAWDRFSKRSAGLSEGERTWLAGGWQDVSRAIDQVIGGVARLVDRINRADHRFFATDAYRELLTTLRGRAVLLGRLRDVASPMTAEEIARLREIATRYATLRTNLDHAQRQLNAYIRTL